MAFLESAEKDFDKDKWTWAKARNIRSSINTF